MTAASSANVTSIDIKLALAEKHKRDFFLTEVRSGSTWLTRAGDMKILDALAIRKSWASPCFTGYEVKISRSDFLRDAKFYTYEELCNCLYIVCPRNMIDRTEVPETVGLMYYDPQAKTITTKKKAIFRKIEYSPDLLLYIIYSRLESDRYPFFSDKKEYFDAYLQGKDNSRRLGVNVKSRLIEENARLQRELDEIQYFQRRDLQNYKDVKKVLEKHGIYGWGNGKIAEELDVALSSRYPEELAFVRKTLSHAIQQLDAIEARTNRAE